jgi:hypothetical protein
VCLYVPPGLEDLVEALPETHDEAQYRLQLAERALELLLPDVAEGADVDVRDLRRLHLAVDLFVFGGRYQTAFDDNDPVLFTWQLLVEPGPPGGLLVVDRVDTAVDGPVYAEFAYACSRPPDTGAAGEHADGYLLALLRLAIRQMLVAACLCTEEDPRRARETAVALWAPFEAAP